MSDTTQREQIDAMSYEDMLRAFRFKPCTDPLLRGSGLMYLIQRLNRIGDAMPSDAKAEASRKAWRCG